MTPLRQRMIEDMQVRNLSPHTQTSYVQQVSLFARHFDTSPERLGPEEIRAYQVYLTNEKKLAPGSILIAVAALRFLYKVTLKKDWRFEEIIPAPKKPQTLPVVLSPEEVLQFLGSCREHQASRDPDHLLRRRPADLRGRPPEALPAIDSQRMVIRVEQGKGQKDRYVMLSPEAAGDPARRWWRVERPRQWLFPGDRPGRPITKDAVEQACQKARRLCGIPKPITPHSLRHAFAVHSAGIRHRRPHHSTAARPSQPGDHRPLPADRHQQGVLHHQSPRPAPAPGRDGAQARPVPSTSERRADGSPEAGSGGRLPPLRRRLS